MPASCAIEADAVAQTLAGWDLDVRRHLTPGAPLGAVVRFARGGVTYTVVGSLPRQVVEAVARGL